RAAQTDPMPPRPMMRSRRNLPAITLPGESSRCVDVKWVSVRSRTRLQERKRPRAEAYHAAAPAGVFHRAALRAHLLLQAMASTATATPYDSTPPRAEPSSTFGLAMALFLVSGATGLLYEVAFSKLLAYVFGATAYAISTVLASFMGGLALGAH